MKAYHYFEFVPSDWFGGNIMYMDWEIKGQFIELCAHYWNKECELSYKDAKIRCPKLDELIQSEIVKKDKDFIIIDFLDENKDKCLDKSEIRSKAGKEGAKKRWQTDSKGMANAKQMPESAIAKNGIKEDKIPKDKKPDDNIEIPPFEEFKAHAETKDFYSPLMEKSLRLKYENWKDSGWCDGYGNPILSWKIKLNNTIKFLEKEPEPKPLNRVFA